MTEAETDWLRSEETPVPTPVLTPLVEITNLPHPCFKVRVGSGLSTALENSWLTLFNLTFVYPYNVQDPLLYRVNQKMRESGLINQDECAAISCDSIELGAQSCVVTVWVMFLNDCAVS